MMVTVKAGNENDLEANPKLMVPRGNCSASKAVADKSLDLLEERERADNIFLIF